MRVAEQALVLVVASASGLGLRLGLGSGLGWVRWMRKGLAGTMCARTEQTWRSLAFYGDAHTVCTRSRRDRYIACPHVACAQQLAVCGM